MENKKLVIGHLYPDLLNLYGDTGNIRTLESRLLRRGLAAEVVRVQKGDVIDFKALDIIFLGGGADREQKQVCALLQAQREGMVEYAESGGVLMAVCGGYQLLGRAYPLEGQLAEGLGILDIKTEVNDNRLIGNVVISSEMTGEEQQFVGFENHAGRTYIGSHKPFGRVLTGHGNNGEDGTCGVVYKNVLGTYLHGSLLPKNPALADYLLMQALLRKYGDGQLTSIEDRAENEAHDYAVQRFMNQ